MNAKSGTTAGNAIDVVTVPNEETNRHDYIHDGGVVRCVSWSVNQLSGGDLGHDDGFMAAHT